MPSSSSISTGSARPTTRAPSLPHCARRRAAQKSNYSAAYNLSNASPRGCLRQLDHAIIFLMIAGATSPKTARRDLAVHAGIFQADAFADTTGCTRPTASRADGASRPCGPCRDLPGRRLRGYNRLYEANRKPGLDAIHLSRQRPPPPALRDRGRIEGLAQGLGRAIQAGVAQW
jgi:hypothetical protein